MARIWGSPGKHRAEGTEPGLPAVSFSSPDIVPDRAPTLIAFVVLIVVSAVALIAIASADYRLCPVPTPPSVTYMPAVPPSRSFAPGGGPRRDDPDDDSNDDGSNDDGSNDDDQGATPEQPSAPLTPPVGPGTAPPRAGTDRRPNPVRFV